MSTPTNDHADLLATIVAATRRTVDVRKARESAPALEERAAQRTAAPGRFRSALDGRDGILVNAPRVIAECKRRSPSRGILRQSYTPAVIARGYEQAGAAAISVLTEPSFFDGAIEHLEAVAETVAIPVLRKDFIVSDYQLLEARACGASAVLLIVAALEPAALRQLHERATTLGLDVLVEVHAEEELAIALDAGASIIGVNNRNLRTLAVDVTTSERMVARLPRGVLAVSESGLRTAEDLIRLQRLGYTAFLMGERFMTEPDPGAALHGLLTRASALSAAAALGEV
jgi:indole-3-glycerol phosphate synthase